MDKVLQCLKNKDTISYYYLFPPFDSLWKMVIHNPDPSAETQKELSKLRDHPTVLIDLDPYYNHAIVGRFVQTLKKGEDSGIQWQGLVMQRFELQKQELSQGMEGLQHIIPERFKGFLFVRDMMSATTYCITITEIQKINGFYCGGQVLNVLEAKDIDQYIARERAEQKYLDKMRRMAAEHKIDSIKADSVKAIVVTQDSTMVDSSKTMALNAKAAKPVDTSKSKKNLLLSVNAPDDEVNRQRREVVDRRYYKGKFDDEIPVELYVRYMKDANGKVTKYWDALYKFGDMSEYVKLDVSKTDENKWLFEEPVATMELDLNGKVYSGGWTNGENQTGYDAELTQTSISQTKIIQLDMILENGLWGKTNEQKIKEKSVDNRSSEDDSEKKKKRKRKKASDTEQEAPKDNKEKTTNGTKDATPATSPQKDTTEKAPLKTPEKKDDE